MCYRTAGVQAGGRWGPSLAGVFLPARPTGERHESSHLMCCAGGGDQAGGGVEGEGAAGQAGGSSLLRTAQHYCRTYIITPIPLYSPAMLSAPNLGMEPGQCYLQ